MTHINTQPPNAAPPDAPAVVVSSPRITDAIGEALASAFGAPHRMPSDMLNQLRKLGCIN